MVNAQIRICRRKRDAYDNLGLEIQTDYTNRPSTVICICRIHQLLLCWGIKPAHNECSGYYTKQSVGEVQVMLELWGMWSTLLLPSFPGPLWHEAVEPDGHRSMGQIELNWIVWNRTVYIYIIDLALNNLQWLKYHKTKPNPPWRSDQVLIIKRICHAANFTIPQNHNLMKRYWIPESSLWAEKVMESKRDSDTNCSWSLYNSLYFF